MRGRVTRSALAGAVLLALGAAGILLAQEGTPTSAPPAPGASVAGELAFSEAILFDYDRDGRQERVQFWIEIEARPAPGEPSPEVESGSLKYFVFDLEENRRIDNWMLGFNMSMGGDFPKAGESYPLTNVRIMGRTASFGFSGATWTISDGGDSWDADTIEIRDYRGTRKARFFGGDMRVVPDPLAPQPLAIEANRECNECHMDAAGTMAAGGGPHRELECASCHPKHPPDVEGGAVPECLGCHETHSEALLAATCAQCHSSHAVAKVEHAATMPDAYCTPCHDDATQTLLASRSLHVGVKCVLCHQKEHAGPATSCRFCHRGTHPEHVMKSDQICASCHKTAHKTERGRAK